MNFDDAHMVAEVTKLPGWHKVLLPYLRDKLEQSKRKLYRQEASDVVAVSALQSRIIFMESFIQYTEALTAHAENTGKA